MQGELPWTKGYARLRTDRAGFALMMAFVAEVLGCTREALLPARYAILHVLAKLGSEQVREATPARQTFHLPATAEAELRKSRRRALGIPHLGDAVVERMC